MATETQQQPPAPELTVLHRLGAIPLVAASLHTLHARLSANAYTAPPYHTAAAVSAYAAGTAARAARPLLPRVAPLVARADGLAHAAVDAVQTRCPYAFAATPEAVVRDLHAGAEEARGVANKTLDDRVRAPAGRVVHGIDQRFTPLVDYLEIAVTKLGATPPHTRAPSSSSSTASSSDESDAGPATPAEFQYQRALGLSAALRAALYAQTAEHARALQAHSALVQRAAATAHALGAAAGAAGARVHRLSDAMLAELASLKDAGAALPAHLQAAFRALNGELAQTTAVLAAVLADKALPAGEKVARVRATVQERVQPLLDATAHALRDVLAALGAGADAAKTQVAETYDHATVNGHDRAEKERGASLVPEGKAKADDGEESGAAAEARERAEAARAEGVSYAGAAKGEAEEVVG